MFIALKRSLKLAWMNFSRNIGFSVVAVAAIAVTIIFITFVFIVKDFSESVVVDIKDKIAISVYFKESVDEETILNVKQEILEIEEAVLVEYISKQEALEDFIERHKDNLILMASLAEVGNPFLASLNIRADNAEDYDLIVGYLNESSSRVFFEKIDYDQRRPIIQEVSRITSLAERIGVVGALVMAFIAFITVFNIVKLAIYRMKEEISIMRLVGVSRTFIRSSFLFQGIIIGVFGVLLSWFIIGLTLITIGEKINYIFNINLVSYLQTNIELLVIVQFTAAFILGIFSSLTAIRKYLKV